VGYNYNYYAYTKFPGNKGIASGSTFFGLEEKFIVSFWCYVDINNDAVAYLFTIFDS
jgi:hypothetical protein